MPIASWEGTLAGLVSEGRGGEVEEDGKQMQGAA